MVSDLPATEIHSEYTAYYSLSVEYKKIILHLDSVIMFNYQFCRFNENTNNIIEQNQKLIKIRDDLVKIYHLEEEFQFMAPDLVSQP